MGGRFTTIEGILDQIYEELSDKLLISGDSAPTNADHEALEKFLSNLKEIKSGNKYPFTIILDDPLSNSYVQNIYAPDPDPDMKVELYDRSQEQDEELGLADMKVEGYENASKEGLVDDDNIPPGHALQPLKEEPEEAS